MGNIYGQEAWSNNLLTGLLDAKHRVISLYLAPNSNPVVQFMNWEERGFEAFSPLLNHRYYFLNMELHLMPTDAGWLHPIIQAGTIKETVLNIYADRLTELNVTWNGFMLQSIARQNEIWRIEWEPGGTVGVQDGTLSTMQVLEVVP